MPATGTGFVWSDLATLTAIISVIAVVLAVVLFAIFGKRPKLEGEDARAFELFERYPLAVMGSIALSARKTVGAKEFIATLMELTAQGVLSIQCDEEGKASVLRIEEGAVLVLDNPLESDVVALLRLFAEDDSDVCLLSAKQKGEERKQEISKAYFAWKLQVKEVAARSIVANRPSSLVQRALLYFGYGLIIVCVLMGYLVAIMPSVPFLVAGALIAGLSVLMQNRLFIERAKTRELAAWLNNLAAQDGVPSDRASVQRLLEYGCVFGIAEKVADALKQIQDSPIVTEETAHLEFFKQLKAELYTDEWHF